MAKHHKAELQSEQAKLEGMLADLELLQTQIARQKRKVAALTELASMADDSEPPLGLVTGITDAVRTVFWSAEKPLGPTDVATRVKALGLPPQLNMLASVHTIMRRLREAGEIVPTITGGYIRAPRKTLLEQMNEAEPKGRLNKSRSRMVK
jgi:hypothetical protein